MKWFPVLMLLFATVLLSAKPLALIVKGKGGSPELDREIEHYCSDLKVWLETHRNTEVRICTTPAEVKNELERRPADSPNDGTTLFLFGHGSTNSRRAALSMREGRLTVAALNAMLQKTPCDAIYLFNTMSAPFLDALAAPGRFIVAATDSERQLNPPRYPAFFVQALKQLGPGRKPTDYLSLAGELTRKFYESHKLAVIENSQYFDGREKHSYPFRADPLATVTQKPAEPSQKNFKAPEQQKLTIHPATGETRKRIADAKRLAERYGGYPAFYADRAVSALLNADKTARISIRDSLYFLTESGCEQFAVPRAGGSDPVRLIYPDGRFLQIESGAVPTPEPGSLLEFTRVHHIRVSGHLPEFQTSIPVQSRLPVANHSFKQSGETERYRIKHYHLENQQLAPIIPEPDSVRQTGRTVITTLPSWTEFLAWSHRMMDRSMTLDDSAKTFTDQLLAGAENDREKVRRIYRYLNDLRYVTTPLGAAAFRPQAVGDIIRNRYGDCKDKASALAAICAHAGIRAERVLVMRGGDIDPSFPSWQFNHMLAYVPSLNLWLDATDGLTPFGDLPPGDHGTTGLVVDSDGVKFRKIESAQNIGRFERAIVREGQRVTVRTKQSGVFDYAFRRNMKYQTPETRGNLFAAVLDSALPFAVPEHTQVAPLTEVNGESAYTLTAVPAKELPPQFDLPPELLRPFSAERIFAPRRLFDGRDWEISLSLAGFPVKTLDLQRKTPHCTLLFHSEGERASIRVSGKGAPSISPEEYSAIRGHLREFRIHLRGIIREEPQT